MGNWLPAGMSRLILGQMTNLCSLQEMIGSYSMGEAIKAGGGQKIGVSPPNRSPTASSAIRLFMPYVTCSLTGSHCKV